MKAKYLSALGLLLVVAVGWFSYFSNNQAAVRHYEGLLEQAQQYEEGKLYKSAVGVYEELIQLKPEQPEWYQKLAHCYQELEWMGEYAKLCSKIIKQFPEDLTGYQMLFSYWKESGQKKAILEAYTSCPAWVQEEETVASIYKETEWSFTYATFDIEEMGNFYNGFAVAKQGNYYGYCDTQGDLVIPAVYEVAKPFESNCAAVCQEGEWFYIDTEGDRIFASPQPADALFPFSEGLAVAAYGGKYGYIDTSFQVYQMEYEAATSFYHQIAAVKKNGKWALLQSDGKLSTDFFYEDVITDEAGICNLGERIFVRRDGYYQMIEETGEPISDSNLEAAYPFSEEGEPAAVCIDGAWGFMDKNGELVLKCQYEEAKSFHYGLAPVKSEGLWGYIDEAGNVVIPFTYTEAYPLYKTGIALVKDETYYRCLHFLKFQ